MRRKAYVRRISAGASLTVSAIDFLKGETEYNDTTIPPLLSEITFDPKRHWVGGGLMIQFAIVERVSVNINALHRRVEYDSIRQDVAGVDNPNTPQDDRTLTVIDGWTRARYLDIPVLARVYNIGRHEPGNRWFFQAGPSLRTVRKVKATVTTTDNDLNVTTADGPLPQFRRNVVGMTAGFGAQFIDPVGTRVIPEVRYTRWLGSSLDVFGAHSWRDQIEFIFSLSF